ncbi:MAG TPA: hypothetical protein VMT62_11400 [Syntrophorhabdaceae bacterium]|nr:hypothetical protein [Syntrophorhabdaceae bacterium]
MDDSQAGIFGLDETFAELYSEGRQANAAAEKIVTRLEAYKNYIPSSEKARKEYTYALLKEYRQYLKDQREKDK